MNPVFADLVFFFFFFSFFLVQPEGARQGRGGLLWSGDAAEPGRFRQDHKVRRGGGRDILEVDSLSTLCADRFEVTPTTVCCWAHAMSHGRDCTISFLRALN